MSCFWLRPSSFRVFQEVSSLPFNIGSYYFHDLYGDDYWLNSCLGCFFSLPLHDLNYLCFQVGGPPFGVHFRPLRCLFK